jgi:hypothetical protein
MTFARDNTAPARAVYACRICKDTGLTYEGTGHRMAGYPWAEKNVAVSCNCEAGKRLDEQDRTSFERERAAQEAADSTPIIELARRMAASTPAGAHQPPHSHGTACRGSEYGDRFPRMFERYNGGKGAVWLQSNEFMLIVVFLSVLVAAIAGASAQGVWLDPTVIY